MTQELPKYCFRVNKKYIYYRRAGYIFRMPDDPQSDEFKREYDQIEVGFKGKSRAKEKLLIQRNEMDQLFAKLERAAKQRAAKAGREYSLPKYWGADQYTAQNGLCAISGMRMRKPICPWDHQGPSIDRFDNDKGYTPENCFLTTLAVNKAKNSMDYDTFVEFCRAVVRKSSKTKRERMQNV